MTDEAKINPEGLRPATLLRLSVGIEEVEDLWRDLEHALEV